MLFLLSACLPVPGLQSSDDTGADFEPLPPPGEGPPFLSPTLLLGAYSPDYLGTTEGVQTQLSSWDAASSERMSFGGVFLGIEDPNPGHDIPEVLGALTVAGYTPFVNLASQRTMAELARGDLDAELGAMGDAVAAWAAATPDALLFVAPTAEMNGDWETYSGDKENFKEFFARIQVIFAGSGVPDEAIRWVFAPNGWSPRGHEFERYYPGDDLVDAIGFSAYQWGGCGSDTTWDTAGTVYAPYIARMGVMAPSKPLFLTQTASTSVGDLGAEDEAAKAEFLQGAYATLANASQVLGVLYFNIDKECDWAVYRDGVVAEGYASAIAGTSGITYLDPAGVAAVLGNR